LILLERLFMASWYGRLQWTRILWPFMWLVSYIVKDKRRQFLEKEKNSSSVPVVVVGNITLGGTGKTPLVQTLVQYLKKKGYHPGIISRGYGSTVQVFPHSITANDGCIEVGDEPFMLFHSLNVPVVIDPKRKNALAHIVTLGVDVVLSDDGMQHYELPRDIEVCVLDGNRLLGNGCLLPVGPLREPASRLEEVDFVMRSGLIGGDDCFDFLPVSWVNVKTGESVELKKLEVAEEVLAIAGIGNPQKFSKTLTQLNINCPLKSFADHYAYEEADFLDIPGQILMTQKDAVKIRPFARNNMWYLKIEADVSERFLDSFLKKLKYCSER